MAHRSKQLNLIQERARSDPCACLNISVHFFKYFCLKKIVSLFSDNNKIFFMLTPILLSIKRKDKKNYGPKAKIIQSIFVLLFIGHFIWHVRDPFTWIFPTKTECIIKLKYLTTKGKCEKNNIESTRELNPKERTWTKTNWNRDCDDNDEDGGGGRGRTRDDIDNNKKYINRKIRCVILMKENC